jgi:hypothetical protein
VSIIRFFLKKVCCAINRTPKAVAFTEFLKKSNESRSWYPLLLRPSDHRQKEMMIASYLGPKAELFSSGGAVFVSSDDAPLVVRALAVQKIDYAIVPMVKIANKQFDFSRHELQKAKKVLVVVDDDWRYMEDRERDFEGVCEVIKAFGISEAGVNLEPSEHNNWKPAGPRIQLFFIDIPHPFGRGMSVVYSQFKNIFSVSVLSSLTMADHEISAAFGRPTLTNEVKARIANSISIIGSGPSNFMELERHFERDLYYAENGGVSYHPRPRRLLSERLNVNVFKKSSHLAFCANLGIPELLDLRQ